MITDLTIEVFDIFTIIESQMLFVLIWKSILSWQFRPAKDAFFLVNLVQLQLFSKLEHIS